MFHCDGANLELQLFTRHWCTVANNCQERNIFGIEESMQRLIQVMQDVELNDGCIGTHDDHLAWYTVDSPFDYQYILFSLDVSKVTNNLQDYMTAKKLSSLKTG